MNDKVYVLSYIGFPGEGIDIKGIYSTRAEAEKWKKQDQGWTIIEFVLDQKPEDEVEGEY